MLELIFAFFIGVVFTVYLFRLLGKANVEIIETIVGVNIGLSSSNSKVDQIPVKPRKSVSYDNINESKVQSPNRRRVGSVPEKPQFETQANSNVPQRSEKQSNSEVSTKFSSKSTSIFERSESEDINSKKKDGTQMPVYRTASTPAIATEQRNSLEKSPSSPSNSEMKRSKSTKFPKANEEESSESKKKSKKSSSLVVTFPGSPRENRVSESPTQKRRDKTLIQDIQNGRLRGVIKHGWLEIATKVGGQKLVWHRRYFCLKSSWLNYYKNEQLREDQCLGWVQLSGCHVSVEDGSKDKPKFFIEHPKHRIFHKHGPDPNLPPCSKKHFMFHKRSSKCRLRCGDIETLKSWIEALTKAAMEKGTQNSSSSDSENEEMYDEGLIRTKSGLSEEETSVTIMNPETGKIVRKPLTGETRELLKKKTTRRSFQIDGSEIEGEATEIEVVSSPISDSSEFVEEEEEIVEEREKSGEESDLSETNLEETTFDAENREGLLKILTKAVGLDISTVAVPVTFNEPTSFLQRMCEAMQFTHLLERANSFSDTSQSMTFVATYAISMFSVITRTAKPFNPYLGETFEFIDKNLRFMAEQVSHHPPIGAAHAENDHFIFWQDQGLKTKFGGNSLGCESTGRCHVILKKTGHHYSWAGIKTVVHNIILGKMWIDHHGDTEIINHNTGESARLEFKKCGWFGKNRHEVHAWIVDKTGKTRYCISGKWSEALYVETIEGPPFNKDEPLWKSPNINLNKIEKTDNGWNLPEFVSKLLYLDEEMEKILPKTDSRLRPDRLALQKRETKKASTEKRKLEERERAKRRYREQNGIVWKPKYFEYHDNDGYGHSEWAFNYNYWTEREQRIKKFNKA